MCKRDTCKGPATRVELSCSLTAICNNDVTNEWDTATVIRRAGVDAHRPVPMPNVTSVISRAIRKRVDWNRIGIAIGVLIVVSAAVILFQLLRDIEADKVVAALQAKSIRTV